MTIRRDTGKAGRPKPKEVQVRKERFGDHMVITTVELRPAVVDFNDILAATEVVPDDHDRSAPWENMDGYEHELVGCEDDEPGHWRQTQTPAGTHLEWVKHFNPDRCISSNGRSQLIVIARHQVEEWGASAYHGASRQVHAEARAADLRKTYAQLREWYEEGWHYWGVTCDWQEFHSSVWGIDDVSYAEEEVRPDVALRVARQLEAEGYTVTHQPDLDNGSDKQESLRWRIAVQLGFDTPAEYRAWLRSSSHARVRPRLRTRKEEVL